MAQRVSIPWERQPKQLEFLKALGLAHPFLGGKAGTPIADSFLYGGAAGGGKSDALLVAAFIACVTWAGCKVGFFRRKFPQLEGPGGAIMRSQELFGASNVAKYNGQMRRWIFKNGSVLQFAHCQHEQDVANYQSQQFDILLFDEVTQFTRYQVHFLGSRVRSTISPGPIPFVAMATNPGNVGHGWVKREYVDIGSTAPGEPFEYEVEPGKMQKHCFIPAFLDDNAVLTGRDPKYRERLESLPELLRRQMLLGDWNTFTGQFFQEFDARIHVVEPFAIPADWPRGASVDWGYAAPCAMLWHALEPKTGRVYTYRELYVTRMRSADAAARWVQETKQAKEWISYLKASPDMFRETGLGSRDQPGPTTAEPWRDRGIPIQPADNRRIIGWNRVREYLAINPKDKLPYWQIFSNCENLVRTMPDLVHDETDIEDVDDECEDHAPEAARYYLMSRPSPRDILGIMPGTRRRVVGGVELLHREDDEDDDDFEARVRNTGGFFK